MNSIMIPWVPTNEYIKSLRDDPKFSEVKAENIKSFVGEPSYTTDFLQNLKWHQEEKGIVYEDYLSYLNEPVPFNTDEKESKSAEAEPELER